MAQILFEFLCGLLYLIGYPFNLTYQEISIYICIYLWPIICCISVIPIVIQSILLFIKKRKWWNILIIGFSFVYLFYYIFYTNLVIERYGINVPNAFNKCMADLIFISKQTGMSYAEVNILIYIVLFSIILIINFVLYKLLKYIKK